MPRKDNLSVRRKKSRRFLSPAEWTSNSHLQVEEGTWAEHRQRHLLAWRIPVELVHSYSKAVHAICFWHGCIFAKVQYNHKGTNTTATAVLGTENTRKVCLSTMILHAAESFTVLLQRYYYKEENWAHSKVSCTIVSQLQCITAKPRPASIEHLPR